jgi:hypothetical protein
MELLMGSLTLALSGREHVPRSGLLLLHVRDEQLVMPQFNLLLVSKFQQEFRLGSGHKKQLTPTI